MINLIERFKIFIIGILAFVLFIFGYRKGTENEENKNLKGNLNAVKKVKNARNKLSDDDYTKRLHDEYKRKR